MISTCEYKLSSAIKSLASVCVSVNVMKYRHILLKVPQAINVFINCVLKYDNVDDISTMFRDESLSCELESKWL